MSITLSANYKETLPSNLVEIVDNLVENGYDLDDLLIVIDYFGDEYAKNFEEILEVLENTGASKSDLYDFLEEHGSDELEHFEKYNSLRDEYDPAAVDAYISLSGYVGCVDHFLENYKGQFNSHREFIEDIMDNGGYEIPNWIHIDYDATWECELCHEYDEEDGYYFYK